jgi:hypothetical protein
MTAKRRSVRLLGLSAAATAVVVAGLLLVAEATGLVSLSGRQSDSDASPAGMGEEVTSDGVAITLAEADYSATQTVLTFVIKDTKGSAGERLTTTIAELSYDGLAMREAIHTEQRTGPNEVTRLVELGPVTDPDRPVTVTIEGLFLRGSRDGPWSFEFVPGAAAIDPAAEAVVLDRQVKAEDADIHLGRIQVGSSDVRAEYALSASSNLFLGDTGWAARMILPDGSWEGGIASQDDPGKKTGDLEVKFPPLPKDVREFTIAFGPYLMELPGPFIFDLPLAPEISELHGRHHLDEPLTLHDEVFEIEVITDDGTFDLAFSNVNPEGRSITVTPDVAPRVIDDVGNSYQLRSSGTINPRGPYGASEGGTFGLKFEGKLDPNATVLTVRLSSLAQFVYGPWDVDVTLP